MALVSVIIPTLDRSQLLLRAIRSVLNQTHQEIEIIVVADRPDDATNAALRSIDDPRLRVIVNPHPVNAASARNLGVDYAKGEWIAFLDDDDEWLPTKIEKQLSLASGNDNVLITCLNRIVTPKLSYTMPQVIYNNSEPLDEYLFDRRSPFGSVGFIQTSSLLMPRSVVEKTLFDVNALHDDWDFVLRLSKQYGVRIETVPEVLVVLYVEELRPTYSARWTWTQSLEWIDAVRPLITRRAYGGFCLRCVGPRAARQRAYPAFGVLLYRALKYGSPRLWTILAYVSVWLLPEDLYRRLGQSARGIRA